jgi:hypothetical protein
VEICFGSFTATSTALVAATSPTASVKVPATSDIAPSSNKKSKTHPPKPNDIVQGMEHVIDMMEETLQICQRAQRSMHDASHRKTFPFGLRPPSDVYKQQAAKSIQIQSWRQQPSSNLKVESRTRRDPLDVPCIYHNGARHTLHGCRLRKKIDQERDVARVTQAPTSPDGGKFQKAQIHMSPNNHRSTRRRVLVVSVNDPPRVGATDSEEAHWIQANANRAQRQAEEQRQAAPPCARDLHLEFKEAGLPTFNNSQANLGVALARLQQANPSPEVEAAMAHVRITTALVDEKSVASKSAASTSSRHSHSRSNLPAHSRLPMIQEEVNQPGAKAAPAADHAPTSTRTGVVAMPAATSTNVTTNARSRSSDFASTTTASTALQAPSTGSWSARSANAMTSRISGVPSTRPNTATSRSGP